MPYLYNDQRILPIRRKLRKYHTPAERVLWKYLRGKRLMNFKFFRQYSVGPFVLDFYCPKARLGIELDGIQHGFSRQREIDQRKESFLKEQNIRLLRFWNGEVEKGVHVVMRVILRAVGEGNSP